MRGEGEEEGSDTFKALKTKGFTISVASSFLSPFDCFSGEKTEESAGLFIYGEGLGGRRKGRGEL